MQWEYKFVHVAHKSKGLFSHEVDLKEFELKAAELGRQNWEMVQFTPPLFTGVTRQNGMAAFKRRL